MTITSAAAVLGAPGAPRDLKIQLQVEPAFVALGPQHLGCGMNNRAWFYDFGSNLVAEHEYVGTVEKLALT